MGDSPTLESGRSPMRGGTLPLRLATSALIADPNPIDFPNGEQRMNKLVYSTLAAMLLCVGTTSYAQTPDGQTPALETGCDGQIGAAFGLCNAYCEAMDCDGHLPQASYLACERVLESFEQITGSEIPSCSGLPQNGESCAVEGDSFRFSQGESLYGCGSDDTVIYCYESGVWACYNGVG
jgi:hypothetical protein